MARARLLGGLLLSMAWSFGDGYYVEPSRSAFWLVSLAGLICFFPWHRERRAGMLATFSQALVIAAVHVSLAGVLPVVVSHLHAIPGAGLASSMTLGALGLDAATDDAGHLLLETSAGARAFAVTWEVVALAPLARLAVAILAVGGVSRAVPNMMVLAGYAGVRALAMLLLVAGGARLSLCYEPAVTLITFLPLVVLLGCGAEPEATTGGPVPAAKPPRAAAGALLFLPAAAIFLGASWGYRDPGRPGDGTVLIDESHSGWEWTEPPFDHSSYGQRSLYGYGLWRKWIELHFRTSVTGETPRAEDLRGADVLVIKTPTSPYPRKAIERIERFVRDGGGLFLIGDHTNLFGMSTVLNGLAAPYGISFNLDDTFPLHHEHDDVFRPPLIAPHPILRGIRAYPFETSCTLAVPWSAEHVMTGRRLGAEMVDYGHVNFFGDISLDPDERFGLFTQAAVVAHGKGRVAAFSDSTNFSNFSFLWPGRRELTTNTIDWLRRKRAGPASRAARAAVLAAGLALLAAGARCFRLAAPASRALVLWVWVGCFAGSAHAASAVTDAWSRPPAPRSGAPTVVFDTSISRPGISDASPILSREALPSWLSFNRFFIDAARSGPWPRLDDDLPATLETSRAVVVINPRRALTPLESRAVDSFLRRGGRLLVLDSVLALDSAADGILAPLGIRSRRVLASALPAQMDAVLPMVEMSGLTDAAEKVLPGGVRVIWRRVGRGRVMLVSDAALLSDRGFGGVYSNPDESQERLHQGQKELFRILMEDEIPEDAP